MLRLLLLLVSAAAWAQGPSIGMIDFYGRRKVSEEALRKALQVKEGELLPRSKGDVEERIEAVPGVVAARLEAACCESGKAILYVGIEERGAPRFDYNPPSTEMIRLPDEIHSEYAAFLAAVGAAVRAGQPEEDLSHGHSLMADAACRAHQERFLQLAADHLSDLRTVLRTAEDDEQRAIAAYVIGYAPKKEAVVNDLQYALRDLNDTVRNNAMRSLGAIGVMAARNPEKGLRIAPTWFIESLESLIFTDRITAANILVTLTDHRDPQTMAHLKERAVPALSEMAQWKHLAHALPSFILLGRVAELPEAQIQALWEKADRKALIDRFAPGKKR